MLTIRLQRIGKIKKPVYRLIISEKARDTQGVYLELLGTYNPHDKVNGFVPKTDRIKYWISKGSQMSETVNNLLVKAGIVEGKKQRSVHISKTRQVKLDEKKKVTESKAAAAAVAAAAPVMVAEPVAPVEAAPVVVEPVVEPAVPAEVVAPEVIATPEAVVAPEVAPETPVTPETPATPTV